MKPVKDFKAKKEPHVPWLRWMKQIYRDDKPAFVDCMMYIYIYNLYMTYTYNVIMTYDTVWMR